jgi:hypothetical protein
MFKTSAGFFLLLALASAASAQTIIDTPDPASAAPAAAPAPASHGVTFSIYERARNDNWQWFAAPPYNDSYSYLQSLLRISVAQRINHWDWQAELTQTWVGPLPDHSVSTVSAQGQLGLGGTYYAANSNNTEPVAAFFKQGFVRYNAAPDKNLRIGRFEFLEGVETHPKNSTILWLQNNRVQQRLVGNFGFSSAASMAPTPTSVPVHGTSPPWRDAPIRASST